MSGRGVQEEVLVLPKPCRPQDQFNASTYLSTPYDDSGNQGLLIEVVTDIIYENHIERFSEVSKQKIYSKIATSAIQ
jgi:hypothetical protein